MRHYHIYLIKEEIATNYFGKELKIFQLFSDARDTKQQMRDIAEKQVDYITADMPILSLHQQLKSRLPRQTHTYQANQHRLTSKSDGSEAMLTLYKQSAVLTATGGFDAETTFFEVLRQVAPYFIAMDFDSKRYGWLKPIRYAQYV